MIDFYPPKKLESPVALIKAYVSVKLHLIASGYATAAGPLPPGSSSFRGTKVKTYVFTGSLSGPPDGLNHTLERIRNRRSNAPSLLLEAVMKYESLFKKPDVEPSD